MSFAMPPHVHGEEGKVRRVGLELEYAGVELADACAVLGELFGGEHRQESRFTHRMEGTEFGDFIVEVDADLLKSGRYLELLEQVGLGPADDGERDLLDRFLRDVAEVFVPYEIVCPPVPFDRLDILEELRQRLHDKNAQGSKASLLNAFGMQLNVEAHSLDAPWLTAMLRAFLVLFPWLEEKAAVDWARRLTPYIDPFPGDYVRKVVKPGYAPDLAGLMEDYLADNPTRNRPLDWLPLFAHLDRERVMAHPVERHLIKPRPAFHYRLPNSQIDDPSWRLADDWARWVAVERLAEDAELLGEMAEEYLATQRFPQRLWHRAWPEQVEEYLD